MGSEAEYLTLQQWFGLILAGIAMWVYNLKDELDADGMEVKGANVADGDPLAGVARSVSLSRASDVMRVSRASRPSATSSVRLSGDRAVPWVPPAEGIVRGTPP